MEDSLRDIALHAFGNIIGLELGEEVEVVVKDKKIVLKRGE